MYIKKSYNRYYEKIGNEYNNIRLDSKNEMDNIIKVIKHYVKFNNAKILDIGCGTGKYGELMQESGYKVIGLDKSDIQINQAKQLIEAYIGDVTNMQFEDDSFDVCTMIVMIQQLSYEDRILAFKEVFRVLKPKGILIIKTFSHDDLQFRFADQFFPRTLEIDRARYPDISKLRKELSMFKTIEVENLPIITEKSKEDYLKRFKSRGTSNLGLLTDEEIEEGIKKFIEKYKGKDIIQKVNKVTFIIARKD